MSENAANNNKNPIKWTIVAAVAAILLIVLSNAFFILPENGSALVQRFGEIRGIYVREATDILHRQLLEDGDNVSVHSGTGLKFKIPFIDNVIPYPATFNLLEADPREVITFDKRKLQFDNSAQWRIENPLRFYKAYNDMGRAKDRIEVVLYTRMNDQVGKTQSHVLITNRELSGNMLLELADTVSAELADTGIVVHDIRIKRTDLPEATYQSIYNRMIAERQQMAQKYISEGEEQYLIVRSETDREVITITSKALREAEEKRGEGDSEAARIYNEAYSRDPEFFEFYNLLDTYRQTVGSSSTLVVPLDSPFAKYLLGVTPEAAPVVPAVPPSPAE